MQACVEKNFADIDTSPTYSIITKGWQGVIFFVLKFFSQYISS